jgi:predicted permease
MFSFLNAWVIHPMPFERAEELVNLRTLRPDGSARGVSAGDFADIEAAGLAEFAAFTQATYSVKGDGEAERLRGARVSTNFLDLLGVKPRLGRTFLLGEGVLGEHRVTLVSNTFAKRHNAAPGVVVKLDGEQYTVTGVLPESFQFTTLGDVDVLTPLAMRDQERRNRTNRYLSVIGRLRGGATVERLSASLREVSKRLEAENPDSNRAMVVIAEPYRDEVGRHTGEPILLTMFAVTLGLLLIACSNVANLLLVRAFDRQRMTAIQLSLGATPGRIARHVLIETAIVFVTAGALSVLAAAWLSELITQLIPEESHQYLPNRGRAAIDSAVMAFSLGLSAMTALLFGLAPSFEAARVNVSGVLKEAGSALSHARRRGRMQNGLVVAQVLLASALLIATGLLVQSFRSIWHVPPGFDPNGLTTFTVNLDERTYPDEASRRSYFRKLEDAIGAPFAGARYLPFGYDSGGASYSVEGRERRDARFNAVFASYFQNMRLPLLRGRDLTAGDREDTKLVAVINEGLARRAYGGVDVIGREIRIRRAGVEVAAEIVGVSANALNNFGDDFSYPTIYVPFAQSPQDIGVFAVRGNAVPVAEIRRRIAAIDPAQPVWRVRTMDEWMRIQSAPYDISSQMLAGFGLLALAIAATGLYSVIAFSAIRRTREFGIRSALGATRQDILRHVAAGALRLACFGLIPGVAAAMGIGKLLGSVIPNFGSPDLRVYPVTVSVLLLAMAPAALVPAWRAARVDPLRALRSE